MNLTKLAATAGITAVLGLGLGACGNTHTVIIRESVKPAVVVTHTVPVAAPSKAAPAPARTVYVPAAPAAVPAYSGTSCGAGLYAGPNTSCPFAENVAAAYSGPGFDQEYVYSPVTGQGYLMTYTQSGSVVYVTGGNNASVQFSY
jgi:hypothetical protein